MKEKKLVNIVCVLMQIIGLVLVVMFRDLRNAWLGLGCGLVIASMIVWFIVNPIEE